MVLSGTRSERHSVEVTVYSEVMSPSTSDETTVAVVSIGPTVPVRVPVTTGVTTGASEEEAVTVVSATVDVLDSVVVWAATVAARRERTVV